MKRRKQQYRDRRDPPLPSPRSCPRLDGKAEHYMFVTLQNVVFGEVSFPNSKRLVVARNTVLFRTLEIGGV